MSICTVTFVCGKHTAMMHFDKEHFLAVTTPPWFNGRPTLETFAQRLERSIKILTPSPNLFELPCLRLTGRSCYRVSSVVFRLEALLDDEIFEWYYDLYVSSKDTFTRNWRYMPPALYASVVVSMEEKIATSSEYSEQRSQWLNDFEEQRHGITNNPLHNPSRNDYRYDLA